jgi:hypothetical protein
VRQSSSLACIRCGDVVSDVAPDCSYVVCRQCRQALIWDHVWNAGMNRILSGEAPSPSSESDTADEVTGIAPLSLVDVVIRCAALRNWLERRGSAGDVRDARNRLEALDGYLTRTSAPGAGRVEVTIGWLESMLGNDFEEMSRGPYAYRS